MQLIRELALIGTVFEFSKVLNEVICFQCGFLLSYYY